jgi:hypothetical protein
LLEQFVLIVGGIVHLFVAITPQMFQVRRTMWCITKTLELGCYTKTEHTWPVCESLHAEIRRRFEEKPEIAEAEALGVLKALQ